MKNYFLLFFVLLLNACSSDENPVNALPAETQIGTNTFGVLIDGKAYKPRCEKPSVVFPVWGMLLWGGVPISTDYNELEVRDLKSERAFEMLIHIDKLFLNRVGTYIVDESNGNKDIDGLDQTNIYCTIFDKNEGIYKKYVSFDNSGEIVISNYTLGTQDPLTGTIVSGTFNGRLRNITDETDEIRMTNGRFDVNSLTVIFQEFK
jgi:hypothetical protein